jgi:hypothetical protein
LEIGIVLEMELGGFLWVDFEGRDCGQVSVNGTRVVWFCMGRIGLGWG